MNLPQHARLRQALNELACNRLAATVLSHPWFSGSVLVLGTVGLGLIDPAYAAVVLAVPLVVAIAVAGYLAAQWRFVAGICRRKPRCSCCKSVMWQLQCGSCGRPVPVLALLFGGRLLAHCPHCDAALSDEGGTLLAWCHRCGRTEPHPRMHFARESFIEIELGRDFPPPPAAWEVIANGVFQDLYQADDRTQTILYRITHDAASLDALPEAMYELASWIWVGRGVNVLVSEQVIGSVPAAARRGATLAFESPRQPGDNPPDDFDLVEWGVRRPRR